MTLSAENSNLCVWVSTVANGEHFSVHVVYIYTFTLVPRVRLTKLHCYCKHCTLYRLGLGLRLGNIHVYP